MHTRHRSSLIALCFLFSLILGSGLTSHTVMADEAEDAQASEEQARVRLAVALNYCRASFYRINKHQSLQVLREEQQKILNNLDLSSIDDAQVISLYTGVIEEINQIQLVDREKEMIDDSHKRSFRQKLFLNAMSFGTQMATFNYVGAAQSGVGSWWDYRASAISKESDSFKLEKSHQLSLVRKTTNFIETSWKLARTRKIPDEWLIRDSNLEELEQTLQEPNLEKRLRILRRKESQLQCYPPFYYYVARIEQSLGRLQDAAQTYRKLRDLEQGHFRKDEMLAAGLANLAAIEHHLQNPDAVLTAQASLDEATDVWEANLVCAGILSDYGRYAAAEDAVLRNLDVDLEQDASRNALALVYTRSGDSTKLAKRLGDEQFVKSLRGPVLLQCALAMGSDGLPPAANRQLLASFQGRVNVTFGRDDLVIVASDDWNLGSAAQLQVSYAGVKLPTPEVMRNQGYTQLVYRGILEVGTPWKQTSGTRPIALEVKFGNQPAVAFQMHPAGSEESRKVVLQAGTAQLAGAQQNGYLLTNVQSENYLLAFDGSPSRVERTIAKQPAQSEEQNLDPRHPSQSGGKTLSASQSQVTPDATETTATPQDEPTTSQEKPKQVAEQKSVEVPMSQQGPIELLQPELGD